MKAKSGKPSYRLRRIQRVLEKYASRLQRVDGVLDLQATEQGIEVSVLPYHDSLPDRIEGARIIVVGGLCGCNLCQQAQAEVAAIMLEGDRRN